MGVTAISIGFGAMYPPMNGISKPFVCPNGELTFKQTVSHPTPGRTDTSAEWFCRDPGADFPVSIDPLKMALYAGPIYGLLLFVVGFFFWYLTMRWGPETVIGKVVRKLLAGLGILAVAFVIIFPLWPLISEYIPGASPTPTPTRLPTAIPTVFVETPLAPLSPALRHPTIASIAQSKAAYLGGTSLEELAREQYLPADFAKPGMLAYNVPLGAFGDHQVLWQYGWCATTRAILADNLKNIQLKFVLDGETVPLDAFAVDDGPGKNGEQCRTFYLALGPWPDGIHNLRTTATFITTISDGNSDYAAGDYVLEYVVSVQN
jgi:hypothetical protein